MKNRLMHAAVLRLLFPISLISVTFFAPLTAQSPCPPVSGQRTSNPEFPGCLPPGGDPFRVLLVLDESGSVGSFEAQFENAVRAFANTLSASVTANGQMQMGIVEFSDQASIGLPMTDVHQANFVTQVNSYLASGYHPGGWTNFVAALNTAASIPGVDIIFFITDGNPTVSSGAQPQNTWMSVSNQIKCNGTYVFAIGLGNGISALNLQALSGPDEMNHPKSLTGGADWTRESFTSLPQALVDLANAQIDKQAPIITCSAPVRTSTETGVCGKTVHFVTTADDNCTGVVISSNPASGSFFPVGQSVVNCTATDPAGNAATCAFTVTVNDFEAPQIECPPNLTTSCETALDPAATGSPVVLDNCGMKDLLHVDDTLPGRCANAYSVSRTWTAIDVHGNLNTCLQGIAVTDDKSPVIKCPPAVTVSCDISPAAAGSATATDNCDPVPAISHADHPGVGDCAWLCTIQRTWTATDQCGNTANCFQTVTKDVTPLINNALAADLDGNGVTDTLVLGTSNNTLRLPPGTGNCVVEWLPSLGTVPVGLQPGHPVVDSRCIPGGNALDANGRLVDPLVAEALKLNILVRLDPALGKRKINTFGCTFAPIVLQNLARRENSDVNELLRVTNMALGKIAMQPHLNELLDALRCIGGPLDVCK